MITTRDLSSSLQFEKRRSPARIHLTRGDTREGCFFVADGSPGHQGPERIGDLLDETSGFVPFEAWTDAGARTILVNPAHILMVALGEDEASRDPGYVVARPQAVSVLLSSGHRITGIVRVYRPEGHDRLSDWTRQPERFRYVETPEATLLLNTTHIVEVSEAPAS